ncbi:MAG TPA: gluconokinase [Steroidobacteraceae bacterium]|nr:gluconokinase [Steroidobacteraceae bacterium]
MTVYVIMGVSGAGKTTVGTEVSQRLRLPFFEGDNFHPQANIDKMSSGIPLTDTDRIPWIDALAEGVNHRAEPDRDAIVACSALSRFVRQRIRERMNDEVDFILLTADPCLIQERLSKRPKHYMKAGMLNSQLAALQMPSTALTVDVSRPLEQVVQEVIDHIERKRS